MYTHIHIYIYIYIYVCVYIYIYIYIYMPAPAQEEWLFKIEWAPTRKEGDVLWGAAHVL